VRLALLHLHNQISILHLDVKTSNVLWDPDTKHAYLIDFGMSKSWPCAMSFCSAAEYCTWPYRAPEMWRSRKSASAFSRGVDAWALGVCVYRLVTGRWMLGAREAEAREFCAQLLRGAAALPLHGVSSPKLRSSLEELCCCADVSRRVRELSKTLVV